MTAPKKQPGPRIITVEPGPWRRRKRLVLPVVLANVGDLLLLAAFVGILVYSCWSMENPSGAPPSHARMRKGAALPVPALDNTP